MESEKKEQLIKIAVATAGIAISAFVLFRLFNRETASSNVSPFKDIVDQRANQVIKVETITNWVKDFI